MKKILIVADPLESFKIYKDTTFAMMRELQKRGHLLAACEPQHIHWRSGGVVTASARRVRLTGEPKAWFAAEPEAPVALKDFDAILGKVDKSKTLSVLYRRGEWAQYALIRPAPAR